jgi:hypothetical protein
MRRTTITTALVGTLAASVALAPAAYAAASYNVPAPGDRTCFTATSNGDGTTSVTSTLDFNNPALSDEEIIAWFDSWPTMTETSLGARWVVVGPTGKTLTASTRIKETCAGIDNVISLGFYAENDDFEAFTGSFSESDLRGSGTKSPSSGTDRDGVWTLPYKIPGGKGGLFDFGGGAGLLNWSSATLSDADGSVQSSTATEDDIWIGSNDDLLSIRVLRQTRGTVSGPTSAKANTSFTLKVQTQRAGEGVWVKHPGALAKIDINTGSGWKYLKTVKTTSTGIYNTKVQISKTTQFRFRLSSTGTDASFTSKAITVKRS